METSRPTARLDKKKTGSVVGFSELGHVMYWRPTGWYFQFD